MIVGNKLNAVRAANGTFQLTGPNPRRVGVILASPSAAVMFVSFGTDAADNDGIRLNSGAYAPVVILFDSPNDWITQPISVYASGALSLSIVELVDRTP